MKNPTEKNYYLTKTIENKWGIAYWNGNQFMNDVYQDHNLSFGIKREFIKEWYVLPSSSLLTKK